MLKQNLSSGIKKKLAANPSAEIECYTISKEEYESYRDDQLMMNCLMSAGVDNWDGWDQACEMKDS